MFYNGGFLISYKVDSKIFLYLYIFTPLKSVFQLFHQTIFGTVPIPLCHFGIFPEHIPSIHFPAFPMTSKPNYLIFRPLPASFTFDIPNSCDLSQQVARWISSHSSLSFAWIDQIHTPASTISLRCHHNCVRRCWGPLFGQNSQQTVHSSKSQPRRRAAPLPYDATYSIDFQLCGKLFSI